LNVFKVAGGHTSKSPNPHRNLAEFLHVPARQCQVCR
jgi:hypothetical protein